MVVAAGNPLFLPLQAPVAASIDALSSKHERKFPRWKADMDWGWNLLFTGVGSKREV